MKASFSSDLAESSRYLISSCDGVSVLVLKMIDIYCKNNHHFWKQHVFIPFYRSSCSWRFNAEGWNFQVFNSNSIAKCCCNQSFRLEGFNHSRQWIGFSCWNLNFEIGKKVPPWKIFLFVNRRGSWRWNLTQAKVVEVACSAQKP